jgi:hypothetical protein
MRITLLILSCFFLATVSGQSSIDSTIRYVPVIYGERLITFVDSLKRQILADTIKFNEADLVYTASGRSNAKPYSKLFLVDGRYLYKLDIVKPKEVIDFTNEILDSKKIKSVTIVDSTKASPLFGPNTWNGIIVITMFDKAKFNPKVAGLTMLRKKQGDNFTERRKGELLIRN